MEFIEILKIAGAVALGVIVGKIGYDLIRGWAYEADIEWWNREQY